MNTTPRAKVKLPFGFSRQQAERLQHILDTNGGRPADLAQEWGISVSAAKQDVSRMRAKTGARTMAELLIVALRCGIVQLTRNGASDGATGPENVYPGVLAALPGLAYNVPILPLTILSREAIMGHSEINARRSLDKVQQDGEDLSLDAAIKSFSRIDDPHLIAYCDARRDRNNALDIAAGLPAAGSRMVNAYGIEWVVDGHVHVPTVNTLQRWRHGAVGRLEDLYPSIVPQNLSGRFTSFLSAVDRCTTKTFLLLDTTPQIRPGAVPGSHCLDTVSSTGANLVFLDAARVHETVLAHEIGHAWVQYVDGCEDERVMEDASRPERIHQLCFVQSFVLDVKVNEVIRRKGFDMAPIEADQAESVLTLCHALDRGYRPPNRREEVFMALLLATQLVEDGRRRSAALVRSRDALGRINHSNPSIGYLSRGFAEAVHTHGYKDRDSIRSAIDQCLRLAFEFTGEGIDLDKDLVIPQIAERDFDKYPQWIEGAPVALKLEVGKIMAREDIPDGSRWNLSPGPGAACTLSFSLPDGSTAGPWCLERPFPWHSAPEPLAMMEINRMNRERRLQQFQPPGTGAVQLPGKLPPGGRRHYIPGLGRFLTRLRLDEQLSGEGAYAYAGMNPTGYIDPTGFAPGPQSVGRTLPLGYGANPSAVPIGAASLRTAALNPCVGAAIAKCFRKCFGKQGWKWADCMFSCTVGKCCGVIVCIAEPRICPQGCDPCLASCAYESSACDCCEEKWYCCVAQARNRLAVEKCNDQQINCECQNNCSSAGVGP